MPKGQKESKEETYNVILFAAYYLQQRISISKLLSVTFNPFLTKDMKIGTDFSSKIKNSLKGLNRNNDAMKRP